MLLTRYISKNLIGVTFFVTLVLTMVIWLTKSLHFLEIMIDSNAPVGSFMKLIFLSLPKPLEVILPIALMTAILFVYNKMIVDNEMVVMRSSGLSQNVLARPAILLSIVITLLVFLLTTWLSPVSIKNMQGFRQTLKTEYSSFLLREGVFNTVGKNITVYVKKREANGNLYGLVIHDARDKDTPPVTIIAKKGTVVSTDKGPSIIVYDGIRQQLNIESQSLSKLYFDSYTIETHEFQNQALLRWQKESERTLLELLYPKKGDKRAKKFQQQFTVEAHTRITEPLYSIIFALIPLVCLILGSFNRRGQTKRILIAVVLVIILKSTSLGIADLAKKHTFMLPILYILPLSVIGICSFLLTPKGEAFRRKLLLLLNRKHLKGATV